jgi:hypothetical protein
MNYNNEMETVSHDVRDIDPQDRSALERLLGQSLEEDARVVLTVVDPSTLDLSRTAQVNYAKCQLPDWLYVYKGMSAQEIAEVEAAILDRDRN